MAESPSFEQWAIVELMGHVRLAGRVTEETHFGAALGRIDVPVDEDGGFLTQWFGGGSVYRITPVSEEAARQVARSARPSPIYQLELSPPRAKPDYDDDDIDDVDEAEF